MRPDARASLSMNAREAPLCGLAFNEGAVKSSKCYIDVSGEEIGERDGSGRYVVDLAGEGSDS